MTLMILTQPVSDATAKERYSFAGMICAKAKDIASTAMVTPPAQHVKDQEYIDEQTRNNRSNNRRWG